MKLNAQETNVNILISNNLLNCRTYFRCKDANKFEASNQHALYSFSFQTNNNILSPNFFINQAGINQADQSLEPGLPQCVFLESFSSLFDISILKYWYHLLCPIGYCLYEPRMNKENCRGENKLKWGILSKKWTVLQF